MYRWSPNRITLIVQLEKVQRKFTKFALNWSTNYSYAERRNYLKLPTLKWRRQYLDLLMTHRIIHGEVEIRKTLFKLHFEHSSLNLRKNRFAIYKTPFHKDIYKHHFVNRVVDVWNNLPFDLLDIINFQDFKKRLKVHLNVNHKPYGWELQ